MRNQPENEQGAGAAKSGFEIPLPEYASCLEEDCRTQRACIGLSCRFQRVSGIAEAAEQASRSVANRRGTGFVRRVRGLNTPPELRIDDAITRLLPIIDNSEDPAQGRKLLEQLAKASGELEAKAEKVTAREARPRRWPFIQIAVHRS